MQNQKIAPKSSLSISVDDLVDPILNGTESSINTISANGWKISCQNFSDIESLAWLLDNIYLVN